MPNNNSEIRSYASFTGTGRSIVSNGGVEFEAYHIAEPEPTTLRSNFHELFGRVGEDEEEPMFSDDDLEDNEDYHEHNQVSPYEEAMNASIRHNFSDMPTYTRDEYVKMKRLYSHDVAYRRSWIFDRVEREGFERRRLGKFSLDDLLERLGKRGEHALNNKDSEFYDWKLGGTKYIIRLEHMQVGETHLLICHYIYTPTDSVYRRDLRFWNGKKFEVADEYICQHSY